MDEPSQALIGEAAPWFRAPTSNGQTLDSEAFHGKLAVVLFFVAQPGTPDAELMLDEFDEHLIDFGHARVQLFGVAPCSPRTLREWARSRQFAVTLLADESGEIGRSFGIPDVSHGERPTTAPPTVVIDRQGLVAARVPRTGATGHAEHVLRQLRQIQSAVDAGDRRDVDLRPRTAKFDR
jgi:thioredoxin-dependent peroxiredoxin